MRPTHSILVPALAGAAIALGGVAVTLKVADGSHPVPDVVLTSLSGVLFVAAGLFANRRLPVNRSGLLMVLVGFGLFLEDLQLAHDPTVFTVGLIVAHASAPLVLHLVLAFPDGRLSGRPAIALVTAAYVVAFGVSSFGTPFVDWAARYPGKPENLLLLEDAPAISGVVDRTVDLSSTLISVVLLCVLVLRLWTSTSGTRWAVGRVLGVAVTGAVCTAVAGVLGSDHAGFQGVLTVSKIAFCLWPLTFVIGVLRFSPRAAEIADLLVGLRANPTPAELRALLAGTLRDPGLRLGEWDSHTKRFRFHDEAGNPVTPGPGDRTVILAEHDGQPVAAIMRRDTTWDDPQVLRAAGTIAGLVTGYQQLADQADARSARLVQLADRERRRVERDLHDGAQQRLVTVAIWLRLAQQRLVGRDEPELTDLLAVSAEGLETAVAELRELARGIHPAILTQAGLVPAVEALIERTPLRVTLAAPDLPRYHEAVEATAYFVVAEAITNVLKHAGATLIGVDLADSDGCLAVTVVDDGIGCPGSTGGSGLAGLADRVRTLDGELTIDGAPGAGTVVRAVIPCGERPCAP